MTCPKIISVAAFTLFITSCNWKVPESNEGIVMEDSNTLLALADTSKLVVKPGVDIKLASSKNDNTQNNDTAILAPSQEIDVKRANPTSLMAYAETLMGTPYVYASTNPTVGFDCSGFITYVFNHFGIRVPRSSIDFTNVGKAIPVEEAKRGDIILFTGTNPAERHVGHMGFVVSNTDTLKFIHATSGKAMSVTVTPLSSYYQSRFVKTIRIFPQND